MQMRCIRLFTDTLGGDTTLLTDEQATVAGIRRCFEQLADCEPDDVVVIAFQGTELTPMNLSDMTATLRSCRNNDSADDAWRMVFADTISATPHHP
jgi:hypothetical protein